MCCGKATANSYLDKTPYSCYISNRMLVLSSESSWVLMQDTTEDVWNCAVYAAVNCMNIVIQSIALKEKTLLFSHALISKNVYFDSCLLYYGSCFLFGLIMISQLPGISFCSWTPEGCFNKWLYYLLKLSVSSLDAGLSYFTVTSQRRIRLNFMKLPGHV